MDQTRLTTSHLPPELLKSAGLVGPGPCPASEKDQRVSYYLYIPEEHYNPDPDRQGQPAKENPSHPAYSLPRLPLVVNVHGTYRDSLACQDILREFAHQERCAVLAPHFPAYIDDPNDIDNYKLLRYRTLAADLVLLSIFDEIEARWPGVATDRVFMIGFSGGGQFVHRFLYLHPQRLIAASVGAPGRVTWLDDALPWPQGVSNVSEVFGSTAPVDAKAIAAVHLQLVVGGEDNQIHVGIAVKEYLQRTYGSVDETGSETLPSATMNRIDTLKTLQRQWAEAGIAADLAIVKGVAHDSIAVFPAVQAFLRPLLQRYWAAPGEGIERGG